MKNILLLFMLISLYGCSQNTNVNPKTMNYKKLTPDEESIIINKGTERPFTGKYYDFYEKGTYVCKQCGTPLYKSTAKFHSGCGWPSFDDEIKGAIDYRLDADGQRTEIMCAKCGGHLGHVFEGEGLTQKNTRHCVNSISMDFIPDSSGSVVTDTAIFAGGCFWGVEYYFQKAKGVVSTEVGYIGGHTINPTYKEVCLHTTGHVEAIRVIFNTKETDFETLAKLFFEIHDPTQSNGQGPDIGEQYLSEVFYNSEKQKEITLMLIEILKNNGFRVVTKVRSATEFWVAEDYHQQYYEKNGHAPYCHAYKKRF